MEPVRLDRRGAVMTLAISLVVLVALGLWLVPWDWTPGGGTLTPPPAREVFTPAQIARAETYAHGTRLIAWSSYAVSLALSAALGFTRVGSALVGRVPLRRWWLLVPAGTFVLLLVGQVVTLPFSLAIRARQLDAGLTEQALSGWLRDRGVSLLVTWGFTSLLLLVVVGLARRFPRTWYAWAGGAAAGLVFVGSLLYPVVVEPLFNHFTPLPSGPLRTDVLDLARREGVHVQDVLVADASRRTTTLNAYVSGFGSTRRIVLYDTTLQELSPRQTLSIVGHELGHARNGDVLLGTVLGAVGALFGVSLLALVVDAEAVRRRAGVDGAADPRSVALLLALVAAAGFLVSPVQNTVSRTIEARADRDALAFTDDVSSFVQVQRELALRSLADPTPPRLTQFWFGSHPTSLQRVGLARLWDSGVPDRAAWKAR